jgi:predicted DCC family thiol-disulfide oxidoreductase YuxK
MRPNLHSPNIIVFDGVCNLCNGVVRFIIKRDPTAKFVFTPMQSEIARKLIACYYVADTNIAHANKTDINKTDTLLDTFLLIKDGQCFTRSDAALEVVGDLSGYWPLLRYLKLLPKPLRNALYNLIARYRYKLFGRRTSCMVPSEELRQRFWR